MKKRAYKINIILILAILIFSSIVIYAHPGRTDSNGGHYDNDSGEYHYHHGYPAHQHTNGVCPYDNNTIDNENVGINSSQGSASKTHTPSQNDSDGELTFDAIILYLGVVIILFNILKELIVGFVKKHRR